MEKEFNKVILDQIISGLKDRSDQFNYIGDLSDLGNEIGFIIGSIYNMTQEDIKDFNIGFNHGVSLTNNTH